MWEVEMVCKHVDHHNCVFHTQSVFRNLSKGSGVLAIFAYFPFYIGEYIG